MLLRIHDQSEGVSPPIFKQQSVAMGFSVVFELVLVNIISNLGPWRAHLRFLPILK